MMSISAPASYLTSPPAFHNSVGNAWKQYKSAESKDSGRVPVTPPELSGTCAVSLSSL